MVLYYLFSVATVNGRRETIVGRKSGTTACVWRINGAGEILTTVYIENLTVETVPNERFEQLFYQETVDVSLSQAPQPK